MSKEAIEMVMNFYHITEEEALEHYTDEVQAAQKLISMKAQELGIE